MSHSKQTGAPPVVSSPLFFLDYDGTLAEIQPLPMEAYPYEGARSIVAALNQKYPLWIVTGRHLRDLNTLLRLELNAIGLHGLQKGVIGKEIAASLSDSTLADIKRMRSKLPEVQGIRIEDKEYTFAVHYRGAVEEAPILQALQEWLQDLPESLKSIWGKKVVELKPVGISKGHAVRALASQFPDHTPVYIGDDVTDEDAFEALHRLRNDECITIKVGTGETRGQFRLQAVKDVIGYLSNYT